MTPRPGPPHMARRRVGRSGAVRLAQSRGLVPISTAVDGTPEPIEPGADGVSMAPGTPLAQWRAALDLVTHDRQRLVAGALRRAEWENHAFEEQVRAVA